ncbi:energy-coupling factor ABC transporter ATP-binding protein [Campylobacter hyointestinalis]|uniref:energy-coupling factor ABC transporter ATP-binding protein n=1 Tax=Campylobacter hyointestinalis TaxID=198 RepID=UPI000DCD6032|nr:ABC transporter ATP-binding protein [Campylobacter hyointestinalis]RAZ53018.1 ABC transporter ATP-binding protein [Campylobacter hyointestinalis subsp. lawsonii]
MSCSVTLKNIKAKIANRVLFENLNLNLSHKEKIAIIGQNGSGKSTLLEIIGGLKMPCDGSVEIFHEPMKELDEFEKYRNLIGFLFQNSDDQFIAPSVIEDVAFSLLARGVSKNEARKRAEFMLGELGISHLRDEIVFYLSGGEKKLVALAGVLITEPKILLLDEPTTALDYDMQIKVANILGGLDIAQIIVSHDKEFINKVVDKVYFLNQNGLSLEA